MPSSPTLPQQDGMHAVIPVDVSRTYVNGYLYAPFRVLENQTERVSGPDGKSGEQIIQRYRTLVLRSDGAVCTFGYLPAPRGTPRQDRVLALSDGTLLSRAPVVDDARASFSLSAITRYREARATGKSAMTLTPYNLLEGVHKHLKDSAVITRVEDYALLAFVVVASYAQAIFDAVPLVQVIGPWGSELGRALARLGCNACFITGHTSVSTAVRAPDRIGGLAVIDDLAGMGRRSLEGEFGEFVRQLGASTKKDTAVGTWTDPTTMRIEKLDLYGVKVVVGALGANSTFPAPALKVYARKPPNEGSAQSDRRLPFLTDLQELRDDLHVWVMENVERIDRLYRQLTASPLSPQEALTAPLGVLADLLGHSSLSEQL